MLLSGACWTFSGKTLSVKGAQISILLNTEDTRKNMEAAHIEAVYGDDGKFNEPLEEYHNQYSTEATRISDKPGALTYVIGSKDVWRQLDFAARST